MDQSWGYEYWNAQLDQMQAEYEALPRWRWLKRSSQIEAIRMTRQIALSEARTELARLRKELGKD